MRFHSALLCALLFATIAAAQSSNSSQAVSESDARQHLAQKTEPIYPPIARAARVQGDVAIAVVIDLNGSIASEKVVSGPAMLQQAALDALKKWRFTPFLINGSPAQATTTLTLSFHVDKPGEGPSAEQEKAAQAWFPASDQCRKALKDQNVQGAMDSCKKALDLSLKAGDLNSSDQLGRMLSHQYYGHALLLAGGRSSEALEQENLAIAEARKCLTDKDQEYAMPFFWRALVEESMGQGDPALADFIVAEAAHRKAILNLPDMKEMYGKTLGSILKYHAALLENMGRLDEAAKLRSEAATL